MFTYSIRLANGAFWRKTSKEAQPMDWVIAKFNSAHRFNVALIPARIMILVQYTDTAKAASNG